jgi:parallel beta-helix repeat protein
VAKSVNKTAWKAWGETHPGRKRENNEDRIYCDADRGIFIVVDGMGGEAAGEEASFHALKCIEKRLKRETGTIERRIREAITAANNEVYLLSQENPAWRGMACVLTLAVIEDGTVNIGHVGDTRMYLIRAGEIRKLTSDHSPVGQREEAGELNELEAMRHPRRNEVYRDVGSKKHRPDDEDFIQCIQIPFSADCALLLCTDGLSDLVPSVEILRAVERNAGNPRAGALELIAMANSAGGKDNVSAIIIEGDEFARPLRGQADLRPSQTTVPASVEPAAANEALESRSWLSRVLSGLTGRWPVFFYGLVLGVLLLSFLSSRFTVKDSGGGVEVVPIPPRSRTLVVEQASTEFPTIGAALEKAQPGDLIEVGRGDYDEQLKLKEDVTLVARNPGDAVIHISRNLQGDQAAITAEGLHRARLSGFVIRPRPGITLPVGIRIKNSDIEISNVEVSGASRAGIWIDGNSRSTLTGSYIHSNPGNGVVIGGASMPRVLRNVIQRNGAGSRQPLPGVQIEEDAEPEVVHNLITENAAEGIRIRQPGMRDRMKANYFVAAGRPNKAGAIGLLPGR